MKKIIALATILSIFTGCGSKNPYEDNHIVVTNDTIDTENQIKEISLTTIFNALEYETIDGKRLTEQELIDKLGTPDSTEDWNYSNRTISYPIRTLTYGLYEYKFNNDELQRITIYEEIPFSDSSEFLGMFNLEETKSTKIFENADTYRASNCGVYELWLTLDEDLIWCTHISYSELFN